MFGFGELFREESDEAPSADSGSGQSRYGASSGAENAPVPSRLSCGLAGIYNQGATCYMNSLLQTLLMTPEFRERLFQIGPTELGSLQDKDKGAKVRVIPLQLQRLFVRLLLLNAQGAGTTDLTDSFGWTNNEELVQHDVQELNRILFSAIEDSLIGTSGGDLIRNLYHGSIVNQIKCLGCGRISEREEDFLDLSVAVSGSTGLEYSLSQNYVETESLDGKNQYRCEECNKLVDAQKGAKLRHLPPILTVSLLRFSFDFQKMERYKETGKFKFPMELEMGAFVENLSSAGCTEYELFSVVVHGGGAHGGHYTAYIRDIDNLGVWTHPDEEDIQLPPDPASGKVDFIECDTPVDLIKVILGKNPERRMKVDMLCSEMMKQTGVSWNKRFKRQYGPINKFLRRYDDCFEVNTENWVSLKGDSDTTVVTSSEQSGPQSTDSKNVSKKAKRPVSPPPEDGHGWFHFNDSRVHPARTKELQTKYEGRASAYMLFYRSKSLARPADAWRNKQHNVSASLLSLICEENVRLEQERVAYETKINTIVLKLLFPSFYTFQKGALQAKDDSFSFMEISIDRRKTISQLVQEITEMYQELCPENFILHVSKVQPAGVHIYQAISDKPDLSIKDTEVTNGTRLFVWDGKQIDGQDVPTGATTEPVLLTVTYGNPSQLTHAFSKSLTMRDLRAMLSDMTGWDLDTMAISRVIPEGEDMKVFKVTPEDFGKTLRELEFNNGEEIVLENIKNQSKSSLADQAQLKKSRLVSFVVENRCACGKDEEWSLTPVEVDRDSTVEELKAVIVSRLNNVAGICRLRCEDDNLGLLPPLHEAQDLEAAGLKPGTKLVLETGEAPLSNEFTLNVSSLDPKSDLDLELIVDRNMTVENCLMLALEKARKSGQDWHLRKTNWCGEAAAVLDDPEVTLADCQLKNGDRILLEEGKLPPKGFLKLEVFLFPSPIQNGLASRSGIMSSIMDGLQGLLCQGQSQGQGHSESQSAMKVGEVVVSRESSLEDLKYTVMTLPGMEKISVPLIEFVRLRFVERHRLTAVLRNHQQMLQRLKVTGGSTLGVQILSEMEELSNSQVVLDIRLRKPNTKVYHPGLELVWDVSQGATFQSLRQAVADLLALPAERLVMAKHVQDKYDWLEILGQPHSQVKGQPHKGKKGKGKVKVNLKHAPYHLKDGDIIGVKDLEFDPQNQDDFSTEEDLEGRERLREEAEQRRKRREELRKANAAMGNAPSQRKEVGIKIHVDNFS